MKKAAEVKERIIEATMNLILESKGDVEEINTRAITKKAHVGTGMINYHFQTKEHLIEICVERIINNVISTFKPVPPPSARTPVKQLKHSVKRIFDFFISNPAVCKISMLSDLKNPQKADNTMKSVMDCVQRIGGFAVTKKERLMLAFALVSVMQTLFLRKSLSKELFGYDLNVKKQRDKVIDLLIDTMLGKKVC